MHRRTASTALILGLVAGLVVGLLAGWSLALLTGASPAPPPPSAAVAPAPLPAIQGQVAGAGPHGGYVLVLDPPRYRLEILYKHGWGALALYLYDATMTPIPFERPPVLSLLFDEASIRLESGLENFDGEEDGGRHFEDDVLLDIPQRARFMLELGDRIYVPPLDHLHVETEEPGHTHDVR